MIVWIFPPVYLINELFAGHILTSIVIMKFFISPCLSFLGNLDSFSCHLLIPIFSTKILYRTQAQLDQLAVKVDALTDAQEGTQSQLDQLAVKVDALTDVQEGTQSQLDRLSLRIDSFVFEVGRLFTQQSKRLDRSEGQTERLEAIVQMLNRNYQAQQSQLQELQRATTEFQRASQEYQRSIRHSLINN